MGFWQRLMGEEPGFFDTLFNYKNPGQFGEYATEYALTNNNLTGHLVVLKNVYVPMKGKTTELDLLMLHEKGIFVFESKNYSGWIFGDADGLNWTQSLPNGQKNRFYNPIRQNRTHIKALADKLKGLTEKTAEEKQQHIDDLQNKCPFCGADLVLRKGKYGPFWGCSTYPKCRFTRPEKEKT